MNDTVNDYIKNAPKKSDRPNLVSQMICADGFKMSVQASQYHYCEPRIDNAPYYELVEIGFPTKEEPLIMEWAEQPEEPTQTVYGYVPVDVVAQVIEKHGGLVEWERK